MKAPAIALALALPACSALDPSVGARRVEDPTAIEAGADAEPDGDDTEPGGISFARDIRPIMLRTRDEANAKGGGRGCFPCHDGNAPSHTGTSLSGLDMATLGELRKGGGSSGSRIVVPGNPEESAIVKALRGQYGYAAQMPKGGPSWTEDEIQLMSDWIAQGAKGRAGE